MLINHLETIADIDLKALYIMNLLKFGVKHIVVKLQTLAAVEIHAEMQFLAYCIATVLYTSSVNLLQYIDVN